MINAVRLCNIADELKRHTDRAVVNDGEYQVHMDVVEPFVLEVYVFDTRDLKKCYSHKKATYNTQRVGWTNQLFMWLQDVDTIWGLEGSLKD
jgi:hypothetical protein